MINKFGKGAVVKNLSVWARLSCYLSKCPLKRDFLEIFLTTFFGVRKFKNTSAMRVIYFLKIFKIQSTFEKCREIWRKYLFVSGIIATEDVAINYLYY